MTLYDFLTIHYKPSRFQGRDGPEWGHNYSRNVCASYQDDLDHRGYACISRHESATNMPLKFNAALEIVPEREGNRINRMGNGRKRVQRVPEFHLSHCLGG